LSVLVTERSADATTAVVSASELFAVLLSAVVELTFAVLLIVEPPAAAELT